MGTAAVSTGVVWAPAMAVVWKRDDTPPAVTPTRGRRLPAIAAIVPAVVSVLLAMALLAYCRRCRRSMARNFPELAAAEIHELQCETKTAAAMPVVRVRELPDAPAR